MVSYPWNILFDDETIIADGLEGPAGNKIRGDVVDLTFRFYREDITTRYRTILNRLGFAGRFASHVDPSSGKWHYREQHAGPSLLVGFQPGYDTDSTEGIWGLIDSYEDESIIPTENVVISFSVFIIGEFNEYNNHNEVRNNHELHGF